jgi:hypothetical protein
VQRTEIFSFFSANISVRCTFVQQHYFLLQILLGSAALINPMRQNKVKPTLAAIISYFADIFAQFADHSRQSRNK